MKKSLLLCLAFLALWSSQAYAQTAPKEEINTLLENWHAAAANADFDAYFSKMAEESVFIGTDPTENWKKEEFMPWAKPYFDRGKAWSFSTLERNIFLSEDAEIGWFDELLDTQMGICRGSGVVVNENGQWLIKHYVLSIAIPNEEVSKVTELKSKFDKELISKLKSQ